VAGERLQIDPGGQTSGPEQYTDYADPPIIRKVCKIHRVYVGAQGGRDGGVFRVERGQLKISAELIRSKFEEPPDAPAWRDAGRILRYSIEGYYCAQAVHAEQLNGGVDVLTKRHVRTRVALTEQNGECGEAQEKKAGSHDDELAIQ